MLKGLMIALMTIANVVLAAAVGITVSAEFANSLELVSAGFYFALTFAALQLQLFVIVASKESERNTYP